MGPLMPTKQGHLRSQKQMGAARGPGSQASLSTLYFQAVLPIAKDGWAVGPSLGSHWGGGIRLGARQTWAQGPLCSHVLPVWPWAGPPPEPHSPHL